MCGNKLLGNFLSQAKFTGQRKRERERKADRKGCGSHLSLDVYVFLSFSVCSSHRLQGKEERGRERRRSGFFIHGFSLSLSLSFCWILSSHFRVQLQLHNTQLVSLSLSFSFFPSLSLSLSNQNLLPPPSLVHFNPFQRFQILFLSFLPPFLSVSL